MELLFTYGTLQLESVQLATFARRLAGTSDALRGYDLVPLIIDDPKVVQISGQSVHTMARFTGNEGDTIPGAVLELTSAELRKADEYEVAAVRRVEVVLESGRKAWAYVQAPPGNDQP